MQKDNFIMFSFFSTPLSLVRNLQSVNMPNINYRSIKEKRFSRANIKCSLMGASIKIGVVLSILGVVTVVGTLIFTGVIGDQNNIEQLIIEVDYYNNWNMTVVENGSETSLYGFGRTERLFVRPFNGKWVFMINASKLDASSNTLSVRFKLRDGTVLKHSSTTEPYGTVILSLEIQ